MRLSEELARILKPPARRKRRPADQAPREIVPSGEPGGARPAADALDAARERLKAQIPPRDEE
ncbi:MAG TPA: hypothetical protein VFR97_02660 [Capillimicrobium sp.]|nr:hypothetical protein [Capillimicrobium sp.]